MTPSILVVCTANVCRSPMAGALLRARFAAIGVEADVATAGTRAHLGARATAEAIATMEARGLDIASHRSRPVEDHDLEAADLVVTMSREHVRDLALRDPAGWSKVFTLKELVRRGAERGPRRDAESITEWAERLHDGRTTASLLGADATDDVDDPVGRDRHAFERAAAEIDAALERLVDALRPSP